MKQLLKEQAKQAKRGISGDSTQSSDRQATQALAELLQGKFEELLPQGVAMGDQVTLSAGQRKVMLERAQYEINCEIGDLQN